MTWTVSKSLNQKEFEAAVNHLQATDGLVSYVFHHMIDVWLQVGTATTNNKWSSEADVRRSSIAGCMYFLWLFCYEWYLPCPGGPLQQFILGVSEENEVGSFRWYCVEYQLQPFEFHTYYHEYFNNAGNGKARKVVDELEQVTVVKIHKYTGSGIILLYVFFS